MGQASEFISQLPEEARSAAVRVPWPGELPDLEGPRAFECLMVEGPVAVEVAGVLTDTEQQVVWMVVDFEFFTVRERWLLPYETPCEPGVPSLAARFDD
ncbi:MAG TPA: hypothetical protein EYP73_06085 [Acidimicrobiia bacterium]|nr:hypothetical protein [Acidimicrobiia bacterium]